MHKKIQNSIRRANQRNGHVPFPFALLFGLAIGMLPADTFARSRIVLEFPEEQQREIRGRVAGADGEPLAGVTVQNLRGGTTSTDEAGGFAIKAEPGDVLLATLLGHEPQRTTISPRQDHVLISLRAKTDGLEEVVVVGYGTQKRSDLTGSVASISPEDIRNSVAASADNILRGKSSGVQVTTTSHQPGGGTSIQIRGNNSINTGSEPLYVIDGFPVYNDNGGSSAGVTVGPRLNALSQINPEDIASIEILKDASATAIYGSRGANGVVIISTKKGPAGKTDFAFNAYAGTQKARRKIPLLNARQFAELVNDANGSAIYSPADIASLGNGTDWQDEIFRNAGLQNYHLTMASGDDKRRYAASINFNDQDGIVINSGFSRISARFNYDQKVGEHFTFGNNLTVSRVGANQAYSGTGGGEGTIGVVLAALTFSPILPVFNPDGSYVLQNDRGIPTGNPVATAMELTNNSANYRTLGNIFAEYQIIEGLRFRTSVGADILSNKETYYAPRTTLRGFSVQGYGAVGSVSSHSWLNENTLTYDRRFGRHAISLLGGFTLQQYEREMANASASGFVNDLLKADNLGSGAVFNAPVTDKNSWSLMSYIARANYGFNNRLLITLTGRVDGSSKFGANSKYGFFPSGAVAYKFSEEEFVKRLGFVSELKVRAGYGRTGNQEIDSYQSISRLGNVSYIIGDNVVNGFATSNIPNPDLKWESTAQYDLGLDIGLWKGRLALTADWYHKKTTDMLLFANVPWSTGFATALRNVGSVENKGVELGVQTKIFDSAFRWSANANITFNRNKVLDLGPVSEILTGEINGHLKISDPIVIRPGQPINSFYGYQSDGIFQLTDDIANSPQPTAAPGDRRYRDINGDGLLTAADRTFIGNAQPKFYGGFGHTLGYKNIDLNLMFGYVYGNKILNSSRADLDTPTGQKNSSQNVLDRWTPTNPSQTMPRASLNRSFLFSDALLEDGAYLRLSTLSLGYTISGNALKTRVFDKIRLYITALNLWTWTNYSGYDPEVSQNAQDNVLKGIDSDAYPSAKTFLMGISLNF